MHILELFFSPCVGVLLGPNERFCENLYVKMQRASRPDKEIVIVLKNGTSAISLRFQKMSCQASSIVCVYETKPKKEKKTKRPG